MALASGPLVGRFGALPPTVALVGLASAGWVALLAAHLHPVGGHAHHHVAASRAVEGVLGPWVVMVLATMALAAVPLAQHVFANSLRWRRRRAAALAVSAYLGAWCLAGVPVAAAVIALERTVLDHRRSALVASATLLVAAVWQISPSRRRLAARCRRTVPLPLRGLRADAASVRFGLQQAAGCLISCGPLMLSMALLTGAVHLLVAAMVTAIVACERLVGLHASGRSAAAAGITLGAVVVALSG